MLPPKLILMTDHQETIQRDIGRLEAGMDAMKSSQRRFEERIDKRLNAIDEKLDTIVTNHNTLQVKVAGLASAVGLFGGLAITWIKDNLFS